jgi:hypothetical protein
MPENIRCLDESFPDASPALCRYLDDHSQMPELTDACITQMPGCINPQMPGCINPQMPDNISFLRCLDTYSPDAWMYHTQMIISNHKYQYI